MLVLVLVVFWGLRLGLGFSNNFPRFLLSLYICPGECGNVGDVGVVGVVGVRVRVKVRVRV